MKKIAFLFCVLMGLAGCATAGSSIYSNDNGMTADEREIVIKNRQEKSEQRLKDVYNGYKLISESNDLFIVKLDGNERSRITSTPEVKETWAIITKDGSCVAYKTTDQTFLKEEIYLQPIGKDSSFSERLSDEQWMNLLTERFPELAQED